VLYNNQPNKEYNMADESTDTDAVEPDTLEGVSAEGSAEDTEGAKGSAEDIEGAEGSAEEGIEEGAEGTEETDAADETGEEDELFTFDVDGVNMEIDIPDDITQANSASQKRLAQSWMRPMVK
jgi:hypothetical protein